MTESWKQWEGQDAVSINDQGFHFRLSKYLGGSEFGAVFLTEWGPKNQRAAIKLLRDDPATADAQLAQLAQLAQWKRIAELSHPHLLRLFHSGRCRIEGTEMLFAVMEYADEDLSQILPERPLTAPETLDMLKPSLEALAYLHSQGFVHGRLKPANIMAFNDQLKLASDGLYTAGERVDSQRRSPYDPPEICDSTPEAGTGITPAADIWSLGITLVEILTQHRPEWKPTEQADPIIPQALPEPFQDIVRNCLRRDPQQRPTIDQISAQLRPAAPAPPKAVPVKQEVVKARNASKKWLFIAPAAVASFAAALFAGSGILYRQQPAQPQPQTQPSEDAPAANPDPKLETQETRKPSPATASASDAGSSPKIIPASLPASPAEEIKTTASDSTNHAKNDGVVQQALPDVPQKARDTIQGRIKVKVRVQVDGSGDVVAAELDSPGPSKYFAQLALQAAQRWKFAPAQAGGQNAARAWLLRFEFGSEQTKVFPSQVAADAP